MQGILLGDTVDAYWHVVFAIDIHRRLLIRTSPCVEVTEEQTESIVRLAEIKEEEQAASDVAMNVENDVGVNGGIHALFMRNLRYAVCLKVLEVYFGKKAVPAMEQSKDDAVFNRFLVSLYDNCHIHRGVQYYANEQHLSPYYFSSIIKDRSGKTAMQWIENVTMMFARQYLECLDLSVKEIADRLKFPDQSAFGRYFKQREGCSPGQYRMKKRRS